jgi:hypothetical protein
MRLVIRALFIVAILSMCSILNATSLVVFGVKLGDYILKIVGVVGICTILEKCV